ncbi:MAG: glycosyltransferase family 4 protein [Sporocytophaga sp.]|uniref:glycosyltransferase family 4 protein n=1 Tax=Sporocytophaga sp. TaxID=2231183 RepID=UPI001B101230|nr:glycosyltransferase family 4 protein [Sporocytophaga sp.]MBO9699685.1 glycosyltransferase family 4 protein [Sporocytophaga sp.]
MKIILSHPTGNANVRAAAVGMKEAGLLNEFHTSIAVFPDDPLFKLSRLRGPFSEMGRRVFDPSLKDLTYSSPLWEIGRLISSKVGFSSLIEHEKGLFCVDSVYRRVDKIVAKTLIKKNNGFSAVYAYEDGALHSFDIAKHLGLSCYYDLPIGYWRTARNLMKSELEKWPEWAGTLTGFKDSDEKLSNKDKELKLADRIFVASTFTAKTLQDYPGNLAKVDIIPYGFPTVGESRKYGHHKSLKVLFVGGLSQRKGIAYLFEAADYLGAAVELTIVGQRPVEDCQPLNASLSKHKWIPSLSHGDILKIMREQDVLVFPSLFEGFGLVITEAMSQGTPVITTDRTAGPDLIENGENGWIIEAGSTDALIKALEELLYNPGKIVSVGKGAMETAIKRPWHVYGRELSECIINY